MSNRQEQIENAIALLCNVMDSKDLEYPCIQETILDTLGLLPLTDIEQNYIERKVKEHYAKL